MKNGGFISVGYLMAFAFVALGSIGAATVLGKAISNLLTSVVFSMTF